MFTDHFYHAILKKLVIAFGSLFNNINIARYDDSGNVTQMITVPIMYGPKEKYYARLIQDPDLQKETALTLPRISFEYTNLTYDASRHLIKTNKRCAPSGDADSALQLYNPTPYNIDFELVAYTKYQEDGNQIVEQVFPFFTPDFTMTVKINEDLGLIEDVPVILNSVTVEDDYEGDFKERRVLMWTFQFTMKTNFYGPSKDAPIIKKAQTDVLAPQGEICDPEVLANTPRTIRVTVTPDPPTAQPGDEFGYTEVIEVFEDGKKYNPVAGEDEEI